MQCGSTQVFGSGTFVEREDGITGIGVITDKKQDVRFSLLPRK